MEKDNTAKILAVILAAPVVTVITSMLILSAEMQFHGRVHNHKEHDKEKSL